MAAIQVTLDHEAVPSPSYHTVPCSPYLRKTTVNCSSPAATVPDVDSTTQHMKQNNCRGRQSQVPIMLNSSPHPSSSIVQEPSISPRTPRTPMPSHTNYHNSQSHEQLVPSKTPSGCTVRLVATPPVVSVSERTTTSNENHTETLQLFSDDENIFL